VDSGIFSPAGPRAERDPARLRLVTVGRLVPRKGTDDVIKALRRLPRAELIVVGGPPADGLDADAEVARLRSIASQQGVRSRVRFTGCLPRRAVAALLRSADVAVCAPWYEPFGIVPVEAMACGVPVVGTSVGGLLDTVLPGITGILVPPRDVEALVAALRTLQGDPRLRIGMGRLGAVRAANYKWPRIGGLTLDAYRSVCDRRLDLVSAEATA
jgi:glycosyltransferase involved in cell wall biosynthesis